MKPPTDGQQEAQMGPGQWKKLPPQLTLRDYFAAAAVAQLEAGIRTATDDDWWHPASTIAERAFSIADAMLKEREK